MKKIIPAILTKDIAELEQKLQMLQGITDWVQIDIADGKFVGNTTIGVKEISRVANTGNFLLEAHLMVENPVDYFEACKKVNIKRVVFHVEAGDTKANLSEAKKFDFEIGLAVNPETNVSEVLPYVQEVSVVLLMSVKPGFGGQDFMPEVVEKIQELKKLAPTIKIEVDGGINLENSKAVSEAGADYLIVGKGLFGTENIQERFKELVSNT